MRRDEIIDMFRQTGALLEGHFKLRSGMHSPIFFQSAVVLQYPRYAERLCGEIAEQVKGFNITLVIGPAVGGVILAYETARHLGARAIFGEKDGSGGMFLRPGFEIRPDDRVLAVDDVLTTGGSVRKVMDLAERMGGKVVAVGCLIDRSGGKALFDVPKISLLTLDVPTYAPEECPLCRAGSRAVEP
ncbi:orotate phosphoribosyltransferase [Candidatus Poribacteria bacterium]|nr:orotate phosphoribosyltransferase [Candidatus Poribacteria bacterium]